MKKSEIREIQARARKALQRPAQALFQRDMEAVKRWEQSRNDTRRYDVQPRAHDGKWVVWRKLTPPKGISMEWQAVHIADKRKAGMNHMWELIQAQHTDTPSFHNDTPGNNGSFVANEYGA